MRSKVLLVPSYSARRPLPSMSSKFPGRSWRMVTTLPLFAVAVPYWLPLASSCISSVSEVSVINPRVMLTLPVNTLCFFTSS